MTYDHSATGIHRAAVDHDIDTIRNERLLATRTHHAGVVERTRRAAGRVLIAAGKALIGRDPVALRTHRA
ncbi:MAG: hypothetical protein H0V73_06660 [Chloroflexi bacterium]|nr:hypothetical protein [Chloroflexota bacterium]